MLTAEQWQKFDDVCLATGKQVLKISEIKYFIIDAYGYRLAGPFADHDSAVVAVIGSQPQVTIIEARPAYNLVGVL